MKIETIVVLVLTAITFGILVWLELQSRRNNASNPPDPTVGSGPGMNTPASGKKQRR